MGENNGINGFGFTIKGDEVPQSSRVDPAMENTGRKIEGSTAPPTHSAQVNVMAPPHNAKIKKKRGRPRKYAADGSIVALSPMPISASIPLSSDYPSWNPSFKKKDKVEFGSSERSPFSSGGGLTPHVITVNPGEDIMKKIISFSQQGYRAICVLAANGSISNVTLRQPNSSGGTFTYEGQFEILSLTGSFMATDNGVTKSTSGGMSVSLAGPDGRVMGGGLAGMLIAADPVQIVIGSFIPGEQEDEKPKKSKYECTISFAAPKDTPNARFDSSHNSVAKPNWNGSSLAGQGGSREQSHGIAC